MNDNFYIYGKGGPLSTILLTLGSRDAKANPTLAAGDVQVSKDGAAFANMDSLPTVTPTGGVRVAINLSATETEAKEVVIRFKDQTSPAEWEEQTIIVRMMDLRKGRFELKTPTAFQERTGITSGQITRTNYPNYGVIFTQNTTPSQYSFDPKTLLGNLIIDATTLFAYRILGGYYFDDSDSDKTKQVFGIALHSKFGCTEGGTTRIATNWTGSDVAEPGDGSGWTFIVDDVNYAYPNSSTTGPLQIWTETTSIQEIQVADKSTLSLRQLSIDNDTGSAIYARSTASSGHGIEALATGNAGFAIKAYGTGTAGYGISVLGTAYGAYFTSTGGPGIYVKGYDGNAGIVISSGEGAGNAAILAVGFGNNPGIKVTGGYSGGNGAGLELVGGGTEPGLKSTGGTSGAGAKFQGGSGSGSDTHGIVINAGSGTFPFESGPDGIQVNGQRYGIYGLASFAGITGEGATYGAAFYGETAGLAAYAGGCSDGHGIIAVGDGAGRGIYAAEIGEVCENLDGVPNAGILDFLRKFADDTGGTDFDATTDSLHEINASIGTGLGEAVWDALTADHTGAGTFGELVGAIFTGTAAIVSKLPDGIISDVTPTDIEEHVWGIDNASYNEPDTMGGVLNALSTNLDAPVSGVPAAVLASTADGETVSNILQHCMAMASGRFVLDAEAGTVTFYKRDNVTPLFVVYVTATERARE